MLRLLCLAALIVPAAATASEPLAPATTVTVATKPVVDNDDKKICRRVTTIGSNIPGKKVCVTRGEYEAAQRAARDQASEMTGSGGGHQSGN